MSSDNSSDSPTYTPRSPDRASPPSGPGSPVYRPASPILGAARTRPMPRSSLPLFPSDAPTYTPTSPGLELLIPQVGSPSYTPASPTLGAASHVSGSIWPVPFPDLLNPGASNSETVPRPYPSVLDPISPILGAVNGGSVTGSSSPVFSPSSPFLFDMSYEMGSEADSPTATRKFPNAADLLPPTTSNGNTLPALTLPSPALGFPAANKGTQAIQTPQIQSELSEEDQTLVTHTAHLLREFYQNGTIAPQLSANLSARPDILNIVVRTVYQQTPIAPTIRAVAIDVPPNIDLADIPAAAMKCPICLCNFSTKVGYVWQPDPSLDARDQARVALFRETPYPICKPKNDPVKTNCGHIFGEVCFEDHLRSGSLNCPLCRQDLR